MSATSLALKSGGSHSGQTSTAVIGLQYGDEGKGQIVDLLAAEHSVTVRYNGGANAGHSVRIGNEKFALHQVPVGVLTQGTLNVLANGVVLSIDGLLGELRTLAGAGVEVGDNLRISDRAHLVMPYHLQEERLRDALAQKVLGEARRLGTTFRGIGGAYADKAARDSAVRVGDLFDPEELRLRLGFIVALKNATLGGLAAAVGADFAPNSVEDLVAICAAWAEQVRPFVTDTSSLLNDRLDAGHGVLFEGANAALLDIDHGTYPYVTSSNSSALGITAGTGVAPTRLRRIIGVAKLYTSRVGTGPFVTELHGAEADALRERGNEYGTTTGRPRRVGWVDLPALRAAVRLNGVTELFLTGLGVLAGLPEVRVCTGYRNFNTGDGTDGAKPGVPPTTAQLQTLEPIYEVFPGFDTTVSECRSIAELPANARSLLERVESVVAPIAGVCVGKGREQVLRR